MDYALVLEKKKNLKFFHVMSYNSLEWSSDSHLVCPYYL